MTKLYLNKILILIVLLLNVANLAAQEDGLWLANLKIDEQNKIPFTFELTENPLKLVVLNGTERIEVENLVRTADSIRWTMPVYQSVIEAKISKNAQSEKIGFDVWTMDGIWLKYPGKKDYSMRFSANTQPPRKSNVEYSTKQTIEGRWKTRFSPYSAEESLAVGEFKQDGNDISGTFMTETGDYRFLSGKITQNTFYLSCFDGSHAFLFKGDIVGNAFMGTFFSGKHFQEKFKATRNTDFKLSEPDELTYIKEDSDQKVTFEGTQLDGTKLTSSDALFKGKATVIQIMGTWCPNCMDETQFYAEISKQFPDIQFVALAYEAYDFEQAKEQMEYYKNLFSVEYPILYAGKASKKIASEDFPMLNEIISFPTTIVLDKKGEVVYIHTGFNGPATSEYEGFTTKFQQLLEGL